MFQITWPFQSTLPHRHPLPAVLASSILAFIDWFYVGVRSVSAGEGKIGGALGGGTSVGGFGALASFSLRWAKILSMTACSSIQAMTLTGPPQRGHVSLSIWPTRT